jgi:hypothetical protein
VRKEVSKKEEGEEQEEGGGNGGRREGRTSEARLKSYYIPYGSFLCQNICR